MKSTNKGARSYFICTSSGTSELEETRKNHGKESLFSAERNESYSTVA